MKERKEENNGNGTEEKKCEETRESIIKMVGDR